MKTGILLVNLGTPSSPSPRDVRRYLTEFLTDERIISIPWLARQILVRGIIIPMRYHKSAKSYAEIWTTEGSPLMKHSTALLEKIRSRMGSACHVELAMRYQHPSISSALEKLKGSSRLIIFPLFPQYASATTGSIHQNVMEIISQWREIPELHFINSFPTNKKMIKTFAALANPYKPGNYDHILISFHGIPKKQVTNNIQCYSSQCYATGNAIAKALHLPEKSFSICFQSRLGSEEWLKPYFSNTMKNLIQEGEKRILVIAPSFVCDCLETLYEIAITYRNTFLSLGGEAFDLVPALNTHPLWIDSIEDIITPHIKKQ